MKYRPRIYYTETDKVLMWDRWQKGGSLQTIAQLLNRNHSSVPGVLSEPAVYVHLNGSVLKLHSACQSGKRFLGVLLLKGEKGDGGIKK